MNPAESNAIEVGDVIKSQQKRIKELEAVLKELFPISMENYVPPDLVARAKELLKDAKTR